MPIYRIGHSDATRRFRAGVLGAAVRAPRNILRGAGASFQGGNLQSVRRFVLGPARAAFQIGLAERHVWLVKHGYQAIPRANSQGSSRNRRLATARIVGNITLFDRVEIPPIVLVSGRNDLASK